MTTGKGISDHTLWLGCSHFVATDPETLIPTGAVPEAKGVMDFTAEEGSLLGPR